jgi:hypothetical protein
MSNFKNTQRNNNRTLHKSKGREKFLKDKSGCDGEEHVFHTTSFGNMNEHHSAWMNNLTCSG